jgi:hypothetical protein
MLICRWQLKLLSSVFLFSTYLQPAISALISYLFNVFAVKSWLVLIDSQRGALHQLPLSTYLQPILAHQLPISICGICSCYHQLPLRVAAIAALPISFHRAPTYLAISALARS